MKARRWKLAGTVRLPAGPDWILILCLCLGLRRRLSSVSHRPGFLLRRPFSPLSNERLRTGKRMTAGAARGCRRRGRSTRRRRACAWRRRHPPRGDGCRPVPPWPLRGLRAEPAKRRRRAHPRCFPWRWPPAWPERPAGCRSVWCAEKRAAVPKFGLPPRLRSSQGLRRFPPAGRRQGPAGRTGRRESGETTGANAAGPVCRRRTAGRRNRPAAERRTAGRKRRRPGLARRSWR